MPRPYAELLGELDPLPIIADTPARLGALLKARDTSAPVAEGKWSPHQIAAHMADAELVFQNRLRFILFEDHPPLPSFDQDRWMTGWLREGESFEDAWERFTVLRKATVRLAKAASPADLQRYGVHSEQGHVTADDVVRIIAGHDLNHITRLS